MNKIIDKVADILVEKKWHLFIGLVIITLVASYFMKNLKLDNSLEVWFLKDDPTLANYNEFKEIYGNDEAIIAWVKPDKDIYDKDFVKKIYDISIKLEKNKLVKRVLSITKAPYLDSNKSRELIVEDMVDKDPAVSFNAEDLKKRISANPLWEKLLLNKGSSAVMLLVEPIVSNDFDIQRPEILQFVKDSLEGMNYRLAGMGVVYDELNRLSIRDSGIFTSISYLILIFALIIFIRKKSILGAATLTIIFSVLLFLGISGFFEQSFNMVSVILPSLIIILCLADIIHIYSHYDKTPPGENRLKRNLSYVLVPCLFTSLTTAIGFLSLSSSPMAVLKKFGIFASIGVLVAYVVTIIVCTLLLSLKEKRSASEKGESIEEKKDFIDSILLKIFQVVSKYYKSIVISGVALILIGIAGITQLSVDTYSINFLLDSNKVKGDSTFIEGDYGLYLPLEVRLKPDSEYGVKDPVFLNKLSDLQARLDSIPSLEKSTSIADVVKQLNRVLTDNMDASYKIPDSNKAVAQELLLYELDENSDLNAFVDENYTEARLTVRIPMCSSKDMDKYMTTVASEIKTIFGDTVDVKYGGYIPLYVKMMDYIIESQISSFLIAFVVIFIIMALLFKFKSFSVMLIGIVPNILPIFMTLGFMGWSGINLDIATVTIAAIAIGISVDDTIHFLFMYLKKKGEGCSVSKSIEHTLQTSGKAMIITSLLLILGYSVLVLASVKSVIFMGLLIAVTMLSALACDLFLLPALLLMFSKYSKVRK